MPARRISSIVGLIMACGWWCKLVAQPLPAALPVFIKMEDNILYRNNEAPLLHFFRSLDSLILFGDRKVSILHLGDSHVQAGFFPNEVRVQFQRNLLLGNGGRGMIFPYKLASTNGPVEYGIQYTGQWSHCKMKPSADCATGIAGYAASTTDTNASITVFANHKGNNPLYHFSQLRILHDTTDVLLPDIDSLITAVEYGKGYTTFTLNHDTTAITIRLRPNDSIAGVFTLYGIGLDDEDAGIVYHSFGVNGATVTDWANNALLTQQAALLQPDLIILSLGTNDAYPRYFDTTAFQLEYRRLLQQLRMAAPGASVILTTPGDSYRQRRYYNSNNLLARSALFRLGETEALSVWDFFSVMGGPNSIYEWYRQGLASADKLHLTQNGYLLQGRLLFDAIMRSYYQYLNETVGP